MNNRKRDEISGRDCCVVSLADRRRGAANGRITVVVKREGGRNMEKRRIAILDNDLAYTNMLLNYVRTSEYRTKMIVKIFTEPGMLEEPDSFDLILAGSDLLPEQIPSAIPVAGLVDEPVPADNAELKIYRFQPLNQLFSQLTAIMMERPNPWRLTGGEEAEPSLISVYSAVGGGGKTALAVHLAATLAFQGSKVFYLSLETVRSIPYFPRQPEKRSFERMLYYLQAESPYIQSKLEQYKSIDPVSKVEYLDPCERMEEMEGMTEQDTQRLLWLLKQSDYDYVIIDGDSAMHTRAMASLMASDRILWLIEDELNHLTKTKQVYERFRLEAGKSVTEGKLPEVSFILNKYTGSLVNDIGGFGFPLFGHLPYVPDWSSLHSASQLFADNSYRVQLMRWLTKLAPEARGEEMTC